MIGSISCARPEKATGANSQRMPASTRPLCFLSFRPCAVSLAVRKDAARRRDKVSRALEVQRRKHHELEGRKLGIPGFETAGETVKKPALHVAITKYLEQIAALKKPNTHRKYEAVLNRFGEFFRDYVSIDAISSDDLTRFVVTLKKDHGLGSNTILHNAVIVAQFLKRHGRSGITKELSLPERITPLVKIYRHEELARFFAACSDTERTLFATFLLTGFREQEVMFLRWSDINFELRTVRVASKPELGFYPKRWEE
jgi:integrase